MSADSPATKIHRQVTAPRWKKLLPISGISLTTKSRSGFGDSVIRKLSGTRSRKPPTFRSRRLMNIATNKVLRRFFTHPSNDVAWNYPYFVAEKSMVTASSLRARRRTIQSQTRRVVRRLRHSVADRYPISLSPRLSRRPSNFGMAIDYFDARDVQSTTAQNFSFQLHDPQNRASKRLRRPSPQRATGGELQRAQLGRRQFRSITSFLVEQPQSLFRRKRELSPRLRLTKRESLK